MKQCILEYFKNNSKSTFCELKSFLIEKGISIDGESTLATKNCDNILIYNGVNSEFIKLLNELISKELLKLVSVKSRLDYLGYSAASLIEYQPLANQKRNYKSKRWLPHWIMRGDKFSINASQQLEKVF